MIKILLEEPIYSDTTGRKWIYLNPSPREVREAQRGETDECRFVIINGKDIIFANGADYVHDEMIKFAGKTAYMTRSDFIRWNVGPYAIILPGWSQTRSVAAYNFSKRDLIRNLPKLIGAGIVKEDDYINWFEKDRNDADLFWDDNIDNAIKASKASLEE